MTHLARFTEKLQEGQAALITSPQNSFYLSDFHFEDGYLLVFRDGAYLLTDPRYSEAAKNTVRGALSVLVPEGPHLAPIDELLLKHGASTLLVEENDLRINAFERLVGTLKNATPRGGASAILDGLRVCKDERELAAILRAQEMTDAAFSHILGYLKPGVREIDVALELEYFMRKQGAEGIAFQTIAVSGSASSLPHGVPRDCVLEEGFLTMDFGARFGGYCSDMTRTVVIGRATEEMKRLYRTVLAAQEAALSHASEGVSLVSLDSAARDVIDGAGYRGCFGHSLGHGVGIDIHEAPRLSQRAGDGVLSRGHVVTVEPGIYLPGKYGCRIEDMIAVLSDGTVKNLTKSTKELIEL